MLLQAGISPGLPILSFKYGKERLVSPLELAADYEPNQETVQMTRLLISFGADVNGFKCKPALQVAIEALENRVECSHTSSSVNLDSEGCLGILFAILEAKPDLEARPSVGANSLKLTALGLAVKLGQLYTAKVLISYGANMFSVQRTYLDSACPETETDILGLASKRGDLAMIHMLLDTHNTGAQKHLSFGFTQSLILAVTFGREETTKYFLKNGVTVEAADSFLKARSTDQRTLSERALAQRNLELHLALVSAGATLEFSAVKACYGSRLFHSIKQKN